MRTYVKAGMLTSWRFVTRCTSCLGQSKRVYPVARKLSFYLKKRPKEFAKHADHLLISCCL